MVPLSLQSSRPTPMVKSSRRKTFHVLSLASLLLVGSALPALAAAPPTSENAYCGKGNVAQFGDKDGIAELPKACYYTALDGTPSPGKSIRVGAGSDLTAAIEHAKCGDTLLLPAGASFDVKVLPSKQCDDQHYITVRTDTPDAKLPPEGSRISPAWAGVASLPGRPPFAQPSGGPAKLLATIVVRRSEGVVVGDHMRFIGIEWTAHDPIIYRLVTVEHANHVIFDRNWIHPAEGLELAHGIGVNDGAHTIAVINSYINGLNCVAVAGRCSDATALGGGRGDEPVHTLKIYNNFLEAAGENILFGGGRSTVNPTDIEIRRNHLFKPMIWKEGEPGYTPSTSGHPYIVKNDFELKSAVRVLFEANLLENSWGGFSQTGFSILLTAVNQGDRCPLCRVNDVTIRFNRIRNVAGGLLIANARAKTGGVAADGGRYRIHDLFVDDVHDKDYKGNGTFMMLVSALPVHDVQVDHVTAFVTGALLGIANSGAKLPNISVTNSVFSLGDRRPPVASAGPATSCGARAQVQGSEAVLQACLDPYKFEKNLVVTGRGTLPKGNIVVGSPEAAGIRDLKAAIGKDPRLCHAKGPGCSRVSPGAGAASDGRDLGADIDAVETAIAGVE